MSNRIVLCDVSGPLTDLLQKLSGENGGEWRQGLTRFLRKENPWLVMTAPDFKVWKIIKLGTGFKTPQRLSDRSQEKKVRDERFGREYT